ncbi:ABC transporter [Actinorhabdospora filicis]|uniref:ABC transporter n=1 Tax=Actinorhabdospora filicis TaxID=1785913 RepID=A0A9W6WCM2_9ACTN|nr:ABC transporter permease [Actinorhabdospora filicis]GLZ80736.1 ABC transporter [Actinorhabdospora filicis]
MSAMTVAVPRGRRGGLGGTVASEWLKLRSVRSTWAFAAALVGALALGGIAAFFMVADYDSKSAAEQAAFESADPSALIVPIAQFCLAALGAIAVTGEYATGMIRTSLTAVPGRGRIFGAKVAVVGLTAAVLGVAMSFAGYLLGIMAAGDRTGAIAVPDFAEAGPRIWANALSIFVMGLLGLGLGTVLRSTAGALVTISALMFVAPIAAQFLPASIGPKVMSSLTMQLPAQIAGEPGSFYGQGAAVLVLALYAIVPLIAGGLLLKRRDA